MNSSRLNGKLHDNFFFKFCSLEKLNAFTFPPKFKATVICYAGTTIAISKVKTIVPQNFGRMYYFIQYRYLRQVFQCHHVPVQCRQKQMKGMCRLILDRYSYIPVPYVVEKLFLPIFQKAVPYSNPGALRIERTRVPDPLHFDTDLDPDPWIRILK